MNIFKKKRENLIKETIQVAKGEVGKSVEPIFVVLAAIGLLAFLTSDSQKNRQQPVIVNIYNKEV